MNSSSATPKVSQIVEIAAWDRWQVYHRLQQLAVPCECGTNQPLVVQINDVTAAMQLWSVVRQLTAPRHDLVSWLERCWQKN